MSIIQPETDLSLNIIIVASDIIGFLKKKTKPQIVEKTLINFLKKDKRRTHDLFFDALTFLYIIEIIWEKDFKIKLASSDKIQISLDDFAKR